MASALNFIIEKKRFNFLFVVFNKVFSRFFHPMRSICFSLNNSPLTGQLIENLVQDGIEICLSEDWQCEIWQNAKVINLITSALHRNFFTNLFPFLNPTKNLFTHWNKANNRNWVWVKIFLFYTEIRKLIMFWLYLFLSEITKQWLWKLSIFKHKTLNVHKAKSLKSSIERCV